MEFIEILLRSRSNKYNVGQLDTFIDRKKRVNDLIAIFDCKIKYIEKLKEIANLPEYPEYPENTKDPENKFVKHVRDLENILSTHHTKYVVDKTKHPATCVAKLYDHINNKESYILEGSKDKHLRVEIMIACNKLNGSLHNKNTSAKNLWGILKLDSNKEKLNKYNIYYHYKDELVVLQTEIEKLNKDMFELKEELLKNPKQPLNNENMKKMIKFEKQSKKLLILTMRKKLYVRGGCGESSSMAHVMIALMVVFVIILIVMLMAGNAGRPSNGRCHQPKAEYQQLTSAEPGLVNN